ncbi:MAG TPA: YIP1 family protein [Candidatus Limnocylindria bacterium]|nr:YIP1 family protein [Candidatus Limnocylindria bacterium]
MTQTDPMFRRMIGAARLDDATYEEIEADKQGTGQAAFIVVATSLLSGAVNGVLGGASDGFLGAIGAFIGWAFYAWVAYIVGVKLFPGPHTRSSWGEIARTLGYANTPRFLIVLALIPGIAGWVTSVIGFWILITTIVALKTALDVSPGRAIAVAIASTIGQVVIAFGILLLAGNALGEL